jgi:hypothetical protein
MNTLLDELPFGIIDELFLSGVWLLREKRSKSRDSQGYSIYIMVA